MFGEYVQKQKAGCKLFACFTSSTRLWKLRHRLNDLGVAGALTYRTHDFRRGHARDLQHNGASLREILNAGEWRSPAFLTYLDIEQLEQDFVVEAHLDESSEDES